VLAVCARQHSIKSGHIGKDGMRQLAHALSNCTNLTFLKYAVANCLYVQHVGRG